MSDVNPIVHAENQAQYEAAVAPIVLRHGERVDNAGGAVAQALEFMLIALADMKDSQGLRIIVRASPDLARKHLAAFLEEAADLDMPIRKNPNAVRLSGFKPEGGK